MNKFALDVTKLMNKSKVKTDTVVKRLTFSLFARCIMMSPVDTGRFRANWQLGVGAPVFNASEDSDVGPVTQDGSGNSSTKTKVLLKLNASELGDKIFLTNNLPYAARLEYGYSKQAPHGMVRLSANALEQILRSV